MYQYSKQILTIAQQLQSYIDAGMEITPTDEVEEALKTIGYCKILRYLKIKNVLAECFYDSFGDSAF